MHVGIKARTNTYILTFITPGPPQKLKVDYLSVDVDAFIPNSLLCCKCQRYGHSKDTSKTEVTCFRYGQFGHDNTDGQKQAKCANFLGPHMTVSKDCPVWVKEKNIQRIKTEKQLSYLEDQKQVEEFTPSLHNKTYAIVAKSGSRTIDC